MPETSGNTPSKFLLAQPTRFRYGPVRVYYKMGTVKLQSAEDLRLSGFHSFYMLLPLHIGIGLRRKMRGDCEQPRGSVGLQCGDAQLLQ